MPSVSVVIPNYNHAPYLKQRIESVLKQTYTDFEIIILDDCSTDNSKAVIEQYRNEKKVSHIVYNEVNSGNTFIQWSKGIELAAGKYIWIAESDDWCERDFLEVIVNGLERNNETAFGYCQSFCVNNNGEILFQSSHPKLEEYCPKENFLEKYLCLHNAVYNASMVVFKKDYYNNVSNEFKHFRFVGDWIFWAELSRLGIVYINSRPLNYFRKHNNDVSSKMYNSGQNFIEELKMLNYFHSRLQLKESLFFKGKVKVYDRFLKARKKIDSKIKRQVYSLIFFKLSFFQKQYFLLVQKLYRFKRGLAERFCIY